MNKDYRWANLCVLAYAKVVMLSYTEVSIKLHLQGYFKIWMNI